MEYRKLIDNGDKRVGLETFTVKVTLSDNSVLTDKINEYSYKTALEQFSDVYGNELKNRDVIKVEIE